MVRLVAAKPLSQYTVWIKYDDGVEGTVDLSHLVGKGVFAAWKNPRLTGKSPEQLFPALQQAHA